VGSFASADTDQSQRPRLGGCGASFVGDVRIEHDVNKPARSNRVQDVGDETPEGTSRRAASGRKSTSTIIGGWQSSRGFAMMCPPVSIEEELLADRNATLGKHKT
jgi:hypothetical protein